MRSCLPQCFSSWLLSPRRPFNAPSAAPHLRSPDDLLRQPALIKSSPHKRCAGMKVNADAAGQLVHAGLLPVRLCALAEAPEQWRRKSGRFRRRLPLSVSRPSALLPPVKAAPAMPGLAAGKSVLEAPAEERYSVLKSIYWFSGFDLILRSSFLKRVVAPAAGAAWPLGCARCGSVGEISTLLGFLECELAPSHAR